MPLANKRERHFFLCLVGVRGWNSSFAASHFVRLSTGCAGLGVSLRPLPPEGVHALRAPYLIHVLTSPKLLRIPAGLPTYNVRYGLQSSRSPGDKLNGW